jgi:hypothetical protein
VTRALGYVLPTLALLVLAAHFYRAGLPILAVLAFGCVALVFAAWPPAARTLQVILALGTLEWLRTAWVLAQHRVEAGLPYQRMVLILGIVAAVTATAAWIAGRRHTTGSHAGPV